MDRPVSASRRPALPHVGPHRRRRRAARRRSARRRGAARRRRGWSASRARRARRELATTTCATPRGCLLEARRQVERRARRGRGAGAARVGLLDLHRRRCPALVRRGRRTCACVWLDAHGDFNTPDDDAPRLPRRHVPRAARAGAGTPASAPALDPPRVVLVRTCATSTPASARRSTAPGVGADRARGGRGRGARRAGLRPPRPRRARPVRCCRRSSPVPRRAERRPGCARCCASVADAARRRRRSRSPRSRRRGRGRARAAARRELLLPLACDRVAVALRAADRRPSATRAGSRRCRERPGRRPPRGRVRPRHAARGRGPARPGGAVHAASPTSARCSRARSASAS